MHNRLVEHERDLSGTLCLSLATLEGDEAFDASMLGYCDEVAQERVCDDELLILRGTKARTSASLILRCVAFVLLLFLASKLQWCE